MTVRCVAVALLLALGAGRAAAQEFDSHLAFDTLRTEHFRFHFHEGTRPLVEALLPAAEATWQRFSDRGTNPPGLTDVVVVDQSDTPNGSATPLPRNRIVLFAAAPTPGQHLNPVDWLETIFVHEFTHVVQLNRSRGWAAVGRALFGRAPWVFPNLFLPAWQIEGLATFEESHETEAGRLRSGSFRVLTDVAARGGDVPPLDRVNGGVTDWPSGLAPYAWGADFHAFLEQQGGDEAIDELAARTASSLPWLGSRAFRRVYGRSLGDLWREYTTLREADAAEGATVEHAAQRLTSHGHLVGAARFTGSACPTCEPSLVYSVQTPDERPAIYERRLDAASDAHRLVTRYGGSTLAADAAGIIYFDQIAPARNAGRYGDLYAFDPASGNTRRLTREARLLDPDVSSDGSRIVAVQHAAPGTRRLVVIDTSSGDVRPVAGSIDAAFSTPRLSPDRSTIVAIRQTRQRAPGLVLVDAESGSVRTLAEGGRSTWAMPTWHPDGRRIVASRSIDGGPFNLVEVDAVTGTIRPLTDLSSGALWPAVSPDGGTLIYTGYTTEGYDLFATDYRAGQVLMPAAGTSTAERDQPAPASVASAFDAGRYRPWTTLLPTSWTPVAEAGDEQVRAGVATMGRDILGYHQWSASATWRIADDFNESAFGNRPDWTATYTYQRMPLQPFAAAWRSTDGIAVRFAATGVTQRVASVERGRQVGVVWRKIGNRQANLIEGSVVTIEEEWQASGHRGSRDRSGFRAAWRHDSAHMPGYGISAERGLRAGTAVEFVTPRLGASASGGTATFDVRGYAPAFGRHDVIAARGAVATSWGDDIVRRAYALGGGDAAPPPGTLGSDAGPLLRGFSPTAFVGRHTAGVSLDYRFPIARPQRGVGTWPALLHSLHGAAVADFAHAWIDRFDSGALKTSVGGEVSADIVFGYTARLTLSGGIAWGHNAADGSSRWSPTVYARVGRAF